VTLGPTLRSSFLVGLVGRAQARVDRCAQVHLAHVGTARATGIGAEILDVDHAQPGVLQRQLVGAGALAALVSCELPPITPSISKFLPVPFMGTALQLDL
jgi:hypothetical protein